MIFDGRRYAWEIEKRLRDEVIKLGKKLKLVTIVDPANPASVTYTNLKAAMAARLGVQFSIYNLQFTNNFQIEELNKDPAVDGIMVQMPYPNAKFLIDLIDLKKDIDGLREGSPYKPAVVRAVLEILNTSPLTPLLNLGEGNKRGEVVVIGSRGFVGRRLVGELKCDGMDKEDFDSEKLKNADVIISCTGQENLIGGSMVKNGFLAIDVGYPRPEFTSDALAKASFYTPVPGGVGPVTVVMLFKNLVDAVLLE